MENGVVLVRILHKIALREIHAHVHRIRVLLATDAICETKGKGGLNLVADVLVVDVFDDHCLLGVQLERSGRRIDVQVAIVPQIVEVRAVVDAQLFPLFRGNLRSKQLSKATSALMVVSRKA